MKRSSFLGLIAISLLSVIMASCSAPFMTRSTFDQLPIGTPAAELNQLVGPPYAVQKSDQAGVYYYDYIERLEIGPGVIDQRLYRLVVVDGKVFDKQEQSESSSLTIRTP